MHFCASPIHCTMHWREGKRPGSCRLISVETLIGLTIRLTTMIQQPSGPYRLCSVGIGGSVLSIQTQFLSITARYGGWPVIVPSVHFGACFHSGKIRWSVMLMTLLWWLLCHPQALELQLRSPRSVTLAGLVSDVTFGEWRWMRVRPIHIWWSPGHAQCIICPHINYS